MLFHAQPDEASIRDWPLHYYEIEDVNVREACLMQYLKAHPDSKTDERRLQILHKRYGKYQKKNRGDGFMRAFMMILVAAVNDFHSLNINAKERELIDNLRQLAVLEFKRDNLLTEEWKDFSRRYLKSCIYSPSYRSALFGAVTLSDKTVALKIAGEIDLATRREPQSFHLEEECRQLHDIMKQTYIDMVDGGQKYWDAHMKSIMH